MNEKARGITGFGKENRGRSTTSFPGKGGGQPIRCCKHAGKKILERGGNRIRPREGRGER